ncbi:MAG TPA: glycosyltransferase, partial [Methylomirabilota bacterium]|nr:glycosyltransferase [Methylomirabilota bacterium]
PGQSVLEIGCGTGDLLAAVEPREGVGLDLSPRMVERARAKFPGLTWLVGDAEALALDRRFDYVIMSDLLGHLEDVWSAFQQLKGVARPDTRVIITYYNHFWEPVLRAAELVGQRIPLRLQNWLSFDDIENLLFLCDFEVVKRGHRFLVPKHVPWLSDWVNRTVARLPGIRRLGLVAYVVARPRPGAFGPPATSATSVSVVVPCRNERGNIQPAVARLPGMGLHTELIFVDGASTDGTREEIESEIRRWQGKRDIKLVLQSPPTGKGDAVRRGFDAATGDVLLILDADLTVEPEDLPKFYRAIVEGKGDLINGSRLVYPRERQAMRFLNFLGNKVFGWLFTWLLEQRITDTLCGTKVLRRADYLKIKANRAFFGDFDPFGDFDLLFGAAKLNLKIVELPVRYRDRAYGTTKISRFRHGLLLFRMFWVALNKLKFS